MKEAIITQISDSGKRLDSYLAERLMGRFSRSQIKRFIIKGQVLVDGQTKKVHYAMKGEQTVEIILPDVQKSKITPEKIPLDIIYEDEDILVVNKEPGMVVHPAEGNPEHTLVNALLYHTKGKLSHLDNSTRPGIVHRLDKEVSGLMVVAKSDSAYRVLVEGFKQGSIKRRYVAFVRGRVPQDQGEVSLPIGRAVRDRKKMAVRFFHSKQALTRYKVLRRYAAYTKLELELETGRTHQIRVHTSYMGYPVIGDTRYGGGGFERIALYAAQLILKHPRTGKELEFTVDMPEELKRLERGLAEI